ncbi:MAG TPA: hypothetical protein VG651_00110 [Stellaceae bacterium]|nr:hypothetical protein [Stellaceae bacterium]
MADLALVFRDCLQGEEWRVEWVGDDNAAEVAVFWGPGAHRRAIHYANCQYGQFEEIDPPPSAG